MTCSLVELVNMYHVINNTTTTIDYSCSYKRSSCDRTLPIVSAFSFSKSLRASSSVTPSRSTKYLKVIRLQRFEAKYLFRSCRYLYLVTYTRQGGGPTTTSIFPYISTKSKYLVCNSLLLHLASKLLCCCLA